MKRLVILISFFSIVKGLAQVNADCVSAIPLCNVPTFTFYQTSGIGTYTDIPAGNNVSNPSTNPASNNSGCLNAGELNPQWLVLTIGNSGTLEFVFGASNSSHPQAGYYDWAMWKWDPQACAGIFNNTLPPVRCNWNGSSSGGTGIASTGKMPPNSSPSNFEPPLTVNSCDQFIICISNFSGANTLVGFLNLGTASLSCDPNCLSVTNTSLCAGGQATIIAANSGTLTQLSYSMNPGGFTSTTPTFVVSPPVTGDYTVYATGLNLANIPVTQTAVATVTVYSSPSVSPQYTNTTCTNTFSAFDLHLSFYPTTTTTPQYTVNWSTPTGLSTSTITSMSGSLTPGPYSATITSQGGCKIVHTFTMLPPPEPAPIELSPAGPGYTITCNQPTITIKTLNTTNSYTWTNQIIADKNGTVAYFPSPAKGSWTITAHNPVSGCISQKVITVGEYTTQPTSTISPNFQTISCTLTGVATVTTVVTPPANVTQIIYGPLGGSVSAQTQQLIYVPGYPGTYTHVAHNDVNGCTLVKTFTVFSNDQYPTFDLASSPANFTLGCSTKSVITVNMLNGQIGPGGKVTYTLLAPGASSALPGGLLTTVNTYTNVNIPGTWTAVARGDVSGCETRIPFSVLSNTLGPKLDTLIVPRTILDCDHPVTVLKAISSTPNIQYTWSFKGPASQGGDTISVSANFAARTSSLLDNYSLVILDNENLCRTTATVQMKQNLFAPVARIGSTGSVTCVKTSVEITNQSSTGIPPNTYPTNSLVVASMWDGPSPQLPAYFQSSYVGYIMGNYTMTVKDLNNGCLSTTIIPIGENKLVPLLNSPVAPPTRSLGCGADSVTIWPYISTATTNLTYSWTPPIGAVFRNETSRYLSAFTPGIYRVLVRDNVNGCSSAATFKIETGTLTAQFVPDVTEGFAPLPVTFSNTSFASNGTSSIQSVWSFGNGAFKTTSVAIPVTTTYNQPGTYTITLYARRGVCLDSTYHSITVEMPSEMVVPNVFTPNGDGVNDLFFLQRATNLETIRVDITNRWGDKVYELTSETGQFAWDGKNMYGEDAAEGTYFYIITGRGTDGKEYDFKGTVSLIR